MYGFLDSSLKRKAFKKALNNAFDSGYDPSKVASNENTTKKLGKNVEPINFEKPQVKPLSNSARSLRKPESNVVDLSKHKNWREDKLKKEEKPAMSSGVSLYDELFGTSSKDVEPKVSDKTYSNAMLDELLPETNEKRDAEEFFFPDDERVMGEAEVQVPDTKDESELSWEELFSKLSQNDDDAAETSEKVEEVEIPQIPQVEISVEDEDVRETTVAEEEPKTPAKPKVASKKSSTKNNTTKSSTAKRNKKRKNKIKFDADIIGGW